MTSSIKMLCLYCNQDLTVIGSRICTKCDPDVKDILSGVVTSPPMCDRCYKFIHKQEHESPMTEDAPIVGKKSHYNQMNIPCCIERKLNAKGHYVATGNFKPEFDWVLEEGVVAAEHIRGTNVCVTTTRVESRPDIFCITTRRNPMVEYFGNPELYVAVGESIDRGLIEFPNKETDSDLSHCGTVVHIGQWTQERTAFGYPYWVSRDFQKRRMSYGQWGKHPKTVENISNWLKEDLFSRLKCGFDEYIGCGKPTHAKQYNHHRPYGIVFFHPDGRCARVTCDNFEWYYEEGLGRSSSRGASKKRMTKEQWEALSDDEKQAIRKAKAERFSSVR